MEYKDSYKTIMTLTRQTLPIKCNFQGREYEINFTRSGGLIMTGVKKDSNNIDKTPIMK